MENHLSEPVAWVGQERLGYVINASFSEDNTTTLSTWLEGLTMITPIGMYPMRPDGLHVTVLDWVAPLVDYGTDKRELYEGVYRSYNRAFDRAAASIQPFDIHFNEVRVTPGAIILVGQDGGQFQKLREHFMSEITLPEGGKQPPNIVHSSLARFVMPVIELEPVQKYVAENPIDLIQTVQDFRLVETRREPMEDFSVLRTYPLVRPLLGENA